MHALETDSDGTSLIPAFAADVTTHSAYGSPVVFLPLYQLLQRLYVSMLWLCFTSSGAVNLWAIYLKVSWCF